MAGPNTQHPIHRLMMMLLYGAGLRLMGYDIRTVQELLRHRHVSATVIYTYVLNRSGKGVHSPADQLGIESGSRL
jgi:site-specific recombinase XerD